MKKLTSTIILSTFVIGTSAFAMGMGGMMDMDSMHTQDKKMDHMMERMEKSGNSKDRMKMMHEHMEMMMNMKGMMGDANMHEKMMKDMNMDQRMEHMGNRMNMMQMMMENMMDQQKMMMDMK
ncbi:MAG: hypothetical protein OEY52_05395 [Gammaproteobacteria bacterium]|nr:hypothetical protein [Gammaproteobacteria bacterium]